jgi:hypothetical protein
MQARVIGLSVECETNDHVGVALEALKVVMVIVIV